MLEKQKEVLEKSLKYEREEKKELEKIIENLKEELETARNGSNLFGKEEDTQEENFNEDFREVIIFLKILQWGYDNLNYSSLSLKINFI